MSDREDGEEFFPRFVRDLPEADIPIPGLKSRLLQGKKQQILFMEFAADAEFPEHCHEAQWGVVLAGRMELVVDGRKRVLTRGHSYFIQAGQKHSSKIHAGYKDMTVFNQTNRYRPADKVRGRSSVPE